MEILWTKSGLSTLGEISDFIAKDSPQNADRFIEEIFDKVNLLINAPRIGSKPPELEGSEFLQILHGNYKIIYAIEDNLIPIVAVLHGSRDFSRLRKDLNI
jgi:plasmid stabilization system protein ParE